MSSKVGMKKHGDKSIQVLCDEFLQSHDVGIFKPMKRSDLTRHQTRDSLQAMSIVKEKRDGSLKGRTCADGRKQRGWCTKKETTSPNAHNESLMMVATIEAHEGRAVGTGDIKVVCLYAK